MESKVIFFSYNYEGFCHDCVVLIWVNLQCLNFKICEFSIFHILARFK